MVSFIFGMIVNTSVTTSDVGGETKKMGVRQSEESKVKIAQTVANLIWITDGKANKRINKLEPLPEGYRRGRTKQPTL